MTNLFKFPLKIVKDSGTIRIEQSNNETIVPEFLWNGERWHYDQQLARAEAIVEALEIVYNHQNGVVKGEDNFCAEPAHEEKPKMSQSERMREYWRKRREKSSSQT